MTERGELLQRDLLRAQLELTRLARREGHRVLASHTVWAESPILRRYRQLEEVPGALRTLCETLALFVADLDAVDFAVQIDAWIEIQLAQGRIRPDERDLVRAVRDAAVAFHGGAHPEQAARAGRSRLPAAHRISTVELTKIQLAEG